MKALRLIALGLLAACGPGGTGDTSPTTTTPSRSTAEVPAPPGSSSLPPARPLPEDVHWTTRSFLDGHRFAIAAAEGVVFHGEPARLSPITVADVTADGIPDLVLRRQGEVHVFRGETLAKTNERGEASATLRHAPDDPLAPEAVITHSGRLWTKLERGEETSLELSRTLEGPGEARLRYAESAFHAGEGVFLVSATWARYWPRLIPGSINSSEAGSYVTIEGAGGAPRFFAIPDFDGDEKSDVAVLAGNYEEWIGDERWTGAIWFLSTKTLAEKLKSKPHLTSLRLPRDAALSLERVGGTKTYDFANRTTSVVHGDTLVAGSLVEFKKAQKHASIKMLFHVYDISAGPSQSPASVCAMSFKRAATPVVHVDHSARVAGVADFNGDGHLDIVVWEEGKNPTTGKRGRVFVGFGPYCD